MFFNKLKIKNTSNDDFGKKYWNYGAQTLRIKHFILGHIITQLKANNPVIYIKPDAFRETKCSHHIIHHVRCHKLLIGIKFIKHYSPVQQTSYSEIHISERVKKWLLGSHYQPFFINSRLLTITVPKVRSSEQRIKYLMVDTDPDPPDIKKSKVKEHLVEWDPNEWKTND
jgi:hypothetical protein